MEKAYINDRGGKKVFLLSCLLLWLLFPSTGRGELCGNEKIRVVSYNIWNGFEKDAGRKDKFTGWIKQQNPDIVALEELVGFTENDLKELAASYGHPYAAIVKEEGYPVGITSRKPITVVTRQVEGFWHGMLHVKTYGIDVIVTHLSPFEWQYRLKEARAITEYIRERKLDSCLVMGDFNAYSPFDADEVESHTALKANMAEWDKKQPVYRNMRGNKFDYSVLACFLSSGFADACQLFVPAAQRMSYPAAFLYNWSWGDPRLKMLGERLDYILVSPALTPYCTQARVHNGTETEGISDHYPVSVELALPQRAQITVLWENEAQEIDGFGVAQAGWADRLYAHTQREKVMDLLFGADGLRLNILRGEVFPHYWENENDRSFDTGKEIDMALTDTFFNTMDNDLLRRGQLWVTRRAKKVYGVENLLFSVWSAPAYMKSNGKVSKGFLKPEYYQPFADYLAAFCLAYEAVGLKVNALSPSNEPGYEAEWNSCKWQPAEMGKFLMENLGPTFRKKCPDVKIVYGENCLWSTPRHPKLAFISSKKFVDEIIDLYPDINQYVQIASGHGYEIPASVAGGEEELVEVPVEPYTKAVKKGQKVWLTEISDIDALDPGIDNGLKWAALFHRYLTEAQVNALIWWGGALPTSNNESLIVLDPDRAGYSVTKRYETFGNYSRYIPSGSKRIETERVNCAENIRVSAFKKGNRYVVVAINLSNREKACRLDIKGGKPAGDLLVYATHASACWNQSALPVTENNDYSLVLPARSVVTYVGEIK